MRTIKFRGKRIINDDWIYGDLFREIALTPTGRKRKSEYNGFWAIQAETSDGIKSYSVDTKTVGQFTGMCFDGNEIYEGDIIHGILGHSPKIIEITGEVKYQDGAFVLRDIHYDPNAYNIMLAALMDGVVIGNIHDNPEMLKGGQNG